MHRCGFYLFIILTFLLLTSCIGTLWTGASLIYDRHNVYKKVYDYQLALQANQALFADRLLKQEGCYLDLAVFKGDILLAGHLPNRKLRHLAEARLRTLEGYREIFLQVAVYSAPANDLTDAWLTTKIRSQILADAEIDPNDFKIVTVDNIVYVMGDVRPNQAARVLNLAKNTQGVMRVVKLMRYLNLSEAPAG
ncbi:hemolysin, lipoprotein [Legionella busanensis]|uniref:Hemolysin, lipoprotein n=1 Tax=Legionella busanensis TaxID=190655 RepID=A0A378JS37_9GAMM|nr:BON domain-containing protein [Legionella busanensis]STX52919.1 hemolysin, lipoprotein [Legionella busanensis]